VDPQRPRLPRHRPGGLIPTPLPVCLSFFRRGFAPSRFPVWRETGPAGLRPNTHRKHPLMHPAFPLSAPLPQKDRPKTTPQDGAVLFTGPLGTEQRFRHTLADLGLTVPGVSPNTVVTLGRDPFAALLIPAKD